MKVFVTQERRDIDYAKAEEYGDIEFLSDKTIWPTSSDKFKRDVIKNIASKLKIFNPAEDFIVTTGSPINITLVALQLQYFFPNTEIRYLIWSNRDNRYTPISIITCPFSN